MGNNMRDCLDLIIIGAGMAGLSAARTAQAMGKSVLLLDKGRRIGGRVATRRADGFIFNHGAQFLTARDPDFGALCAMASAERALASWELDGRAAFVGSPFMRAFPAYIGAGLNVTQECEITQISRNEDYIEVTNETGFSARATALIVTAPAPQTQNLLSEIAPELAATATTARYAPCWTALFGFAEIPAACPKLVRDDAILGWAGWEAHRPAGVPTNAALTIQASAEWSATHIENDRPERLMELKAAYEAHTGITLPEPEYAAAHRWLYAKVTQPADASAPIQSHCGQIAIAGDWLGGARIEHAFVTGRNAAQALFTQPV